MPSSKTYEALGLDVARFKPEINAFLLVKATGPLHSNKRKEE